MNSLNNSTNFVLKIIFTFFLNIKFQIGKNINNSYKSLFYKISPESNTIILFVLFTISGTSMRVYSPTSLHSPFALFPKSYSACFPLYSINSIFL